MTGSHETALVKTLCVPCVKGLESRWKAVRRSGNSLKATCDLCQRRRYCGRWALEPRTGQNDR